jgi:hypothetical protein
MDTITWSWQYPYLSAFRNHMRAALAPGFQALHCQLENGLAVPIGINRRASSNNESLVYCQDDSRERMLCLQQSNQYRLENDRGTALGLATGNLHCAFRSMQENKPHLARRSGRCSLRSSHFS